MIVNDIESRHSGDTGGFESSLRRPALLWLAATGLLLLSLFLVVQDLAGANRPHELRAAPWVAGITLLNLLPCAGALVGLRRHGRARREGGAGLGAGFYALALRLVVVAGLNSLILIGAATTVPAVLRG